MDRRLTFLTAFLGFTAVLLGALGAHALKTSLHDLPDAAKRLEWWDLASRYHLLHTLAVGLVAVLSAHVTSRFPNIAAGLFTAGIALFSGSLYVMALTGAMAGLAAVLLSQTYYISPFSGLTPLIKGVSIALCGGLGSVQGAVIAAILLGLVEAMTNKYLGGQYVLITQFLVIILVLIVRPRGIAGLLDKAREQ